MSVEAQVGIKSPNAPHDVSSWILHHFIRYTKILLLLIIIRISFFLFHHPSSYSFAILEFSSSLTQSVTLEHPRKRVTRGTFEGSSLIATGRSFILVVYTGRQIEYKSLRFF